ncbi:hypothetical protein TSOC_005735 [Tetrabaena socialis]|uniref:Uncharacterized protein n=1 Tax=Tetrabaena socialis TaxID=47790 RepID=A0A2J8A5I9_9CHLO|nr:hypothetical protein TSOC_005735 [Tetrabaena socialis]|eukprot:PNH07767.1 hypothetical protein TSOC_005735 [Tetrabaena socialis]
MLSMAPSQPGQISCPRARKTSRPEPSQHEQCQRSRLTTSLQAVATGGEQLCGELELILQGQPPDAPNTFFGVSPPVRSGCFGGAANPILHDSQWSARALNASHTNLQQLRELDSQHSFMRCTGDYRLLLGSPDFRSLADEVAAPQAQQQETRHLLPFACRAQYFAVR